MKKLILFLTIIAPIQMMAMDGNPQPIQQLTIAPNTNEFLASIDNDHNSQVRYFTERYFPQSVIFKFGDKTVTPQQADMIKQSLIQDFSLGNKVNEERSLNLSPYIKTALDNGYIEQYHNELAKHPLIAPVIKEKKRILNERIVKWNEHMEKQKVDKSFFVPNDSSYKKWIPSSAWIKYPAVIGLSVLFSDHIRYAFWGAVKNAPLIWAKYFARATATTPPSN